MGLLDTFKKKKTAESAESKAAVAPVAKKAAAKTEQSQGKKPVAKKSAKAAKVVELPKKPLQSTVLLYPLVTEKSLRLQTLNQYVFVVRKDANKNQVFEAIKQTYGLKPLSVRMVKIQPVMMQRWGRAAGMKKSIKKAIVHLPAGTTLDLNRK